MFDISFDIDYSIYIYIYIAISSVPYQEQLTLYFSEVIFWKIFIAIRVFQESHDLSHKNGFTCYDENNDKFSVSYV